MTKLVQSKWSWIRFVYGTTFLFAEFFFSSAVFATETAAKLAIADLIKVRPAREVIWTFDLALTEYKMMAPDQSKISGIANSLGIGYGRTRKDSWFIGQFYFLAGPYDKTRNNAFDADFSEQW